MAFLQLTQNQRHKTSTDEFFNQVDETCCLQ
jgi:hypothetical protein